MRDRIQSLTSLNLGNNERMKATGWNILLCMTNGRHICASCDQPAEREKEEGKKGRGLSLRWVPELTLNKSRSFKSIFESMSKSTQNEESEGQWKHALLPRCLSEESTLSPGSSAGGSGAGAPLSTPQGSCQHVSCWILTMHHMSALRRDQNHFKQKMIPEKCHLFLS